METPTQSETVKVGVVGTGIFATRAHLPAMKSFGDKYQIVACANRSKDKAEAYAATAGVPSSAVFTDYQSVIDFPGVEALVVAVPVQYNLEIIKAAAAKGKHVLFEKPIAHSLEDAQGIIDVADAHPELVLGVAENYVYKTVTAAIADIVAKGELGDIISFELSVQRQLSLDDGTNPYVKTLWRQNPVHPGGYLSDGGVHWTALIVSTLGPVARVAAFSRQVHKINGAEDTLAMIFEMQSGTIGTWHQTYAAAAPSFASYIITGTKATLVCDDMTSLKVTDRKGEVIRTISFAGVEGSGPTVAAGQDVIAEFADFHKSILRKRAGGSEKKEETTTTTKEGGEEEGEDFVVINNSSNTRVTVRDGFHHFAIVAAAMKSSHTKTFEVVPTPTSSAAASN